MKFRYLEKYQLKYDFWREAPNYFLFFFHRRHRKTDRISQILLVSKDGGINFNRWKPMHQGMQLYIDKFITFKDVLFCESEINQTFFYVDRDLKIFSAQRYERNETLIPCRFNPSYIIKIVGKTVAVSQKLK
ncbi:hypothetical protein RF11_05198 [Thelohanellus kitauei]|uniref:Uncharacterized protein n=1 Tax=Thelohanellus kitauei TaxID=669202 RepID=A0A0C2IB36_THEKT|nr:hypothetical protein RF11_05198 [Thelohanellus kitauei]